MVDEDVRFDVYPIRQRDRSPGAGSIDRRLNCREYTSRVVGDGRREGDTVGLEARDGRLGIGSTDQPWGKILRAAVDASLRADVVMVVRMGGAVGRAPPVFLGVDALAALVVQAAVAVFA